jgi:hypothetical protein
MSTLNFIPLAAGTGSPASPKPSAAPMAEQLAEKFQSVMERITAKNPSDVLQANAGTVPNCKCQTADAGLSATPLSKSNEGGKTVFGKINPGSKRGANVSTIPSKSDLVPVTDTPVPAANTIPIAAVLPNGVAAKTDDALSSPPPKMETKSNSASVIAVSFAEKKQVAEIMPATARVSQLPSLANSNSIPPIQAGQPIEQTYPLSAKAGNLTDLSASPEKSTAANKIALADNLSPLAGKKLSSLPPVKFAEKKPVVQDARNGVENSGESPEPATIIIKVGSSAEWDLPPETFKLADGTPVAQQEMSMKMVTKKIKIAEVTQQKLPGTAAPAAGQNLSGSLDGADNASPSKNGSEPVSAMGAEIPTNAAAIKIISQEAANLPEPAPAATPLLERTREMMALQVVRLHENGADELRLVIKPDAGTQLSLNLQQRSDGVEVRAVLDRGNFDLLNRHWPELQQQLETRGVRVAPLSCAENLFGGGSEGFRQPTTPNGQTAGDDAEQAEAPAVLVPGLPTATATASASVTLARNWESWA